MWACGWSSYSHYPSAYGMWWYKDACSRKHDILSDWMQFTQLMKYIPAGIFNHGGIQWQSRLAFPSAPLKAKPSRTLPLAPRLFLSSQLQLKKTEHTHPGASQRLEWTMKLSEQKPIFHLLPRGPFGLFRFTVSQTQWKGKYNPSVTEGVCDMYATLSKSMRQTVAETNTPGPQPDKRKPKLSIFGLHSVHYLLCTAVFPPLIWGAFTNYIRHTHRHTGPRHCMAGGAARNSIKTRKAFICG